MAFTAAQARWYRWCTQAWLQLLDQLVVLAPFFPLAAANLNPDLHTRKANTLLLSCIPSTQRNSFVNLAYVRITWKVNLLASISTALQDNVLYCSSVLAVMPKATVSFQTPFIHNHSRYEQIILMLTGTKCPQKQNTKLKSESKLGLGRWPKFEFQHHISRILLGDGTSALQIHWVQQLCVLKLLLF